MPDKFKDTFPVPISFVSGEQPSAAKLTAWAAQTNTALDQIESALGDMHSDFYPLFASTNTPITGWARSKSGTLLDSTDLHLQILNLARLIGPASALNPRILGGITATIVDEPLPSDVSDFYLRFVPTAITSFSLVGTKFVTLVGSPDLITSYGEYFVDLTSGRVVLWGGEGNNGTVTYTVSTGTDNMLDTFHHANFNVYPGPQQATKCTVAASGSNWRLTLPTITDQAANWNNTSSTLTAQNDLNFGAQLGLPFWLTNEYSVGDTIATGLLAIWDEIEKRVISGKFMHASTTEVDYNGEILVAGSARYSILLAGGTDITRTIDNLRARHREHKHDGTNGDMRIDHADLSGSAIGWVDGNGGGNSYGFFDDGMGPFENYHPQYLGRWGNDSSLSKNAMLGNLVMASGANAAVTHPPTFGLTDNSFGIFFGDFNTGPFLQYKTSSDSLTVYRKDLLLGEASTNFGFVNTRSDTVVIPAIVCLTTDPAVAPTPHSAVFNSKVDEGSYIWIDMNSHVPHLATISKIEVYVDLRVTGSNNGKLFWELNGAAWDSIAVVIETASITSLNNGFQTISIILATPKQIDKSNKTLWFTCAPFDAGASGSSSYFYSFRVTFTHDTVARGG